MIETMATPAGLEPATTRLEGGTTKRHFPAIRAVLQTFRTHENRTKPEGV